MRTPCYHNGTAAPTTSELQVKHKYINPGISTEHINHIMLLVQVMAYVMSDMFAIEIVGHLDMRTGIRPADWCARGSDIAGGWDLCRRLGKAVWPDGELVPSHQPEWTCCEYGNYP